MSTEKGPPDLDAEIDGHLEAIRKAFEASEDEVERGRCLLLALNFTPFRPLPDWAVAALQQQQTANLPQEPDLHSLRWLAVKRGKEKGLTWAKAWKFATEQLAETPYFGDTDTMRRSYKIVQRSVRKAKLG